jgi:hypothetical protein
LILEHYIEICTFLQDAAYGEPTVDGAYETDERFPYEEEGVCESNIVCRRHWSHVLEDMVAISLDDEIYSSDGPKSEEISRRDINYHE